MSCAIARVGMTPCHPGEFIREEILHELHLPVARAADILSVRRPILSSPTKVRPPVAPWWLLRDEAVD